MAKSDLLEHVLSTDGWYCVMALKAGEYPIQRFVQTLADVEKLADEFLEQKRDVYFGCAKFSEAGNRGKGNAAFFKAFWLDIDCGEGKPYPTQADGLTALQGFCKALTLPKPTLVNSGRGIHAYWTITETIDAKRWTPIAERLKSLCAEHNLEIDPSATADAARILRIPETKNWKNPDNPLDVSIIHLGKAVDVEVFSGILGGVVAPKEESFIPSRPNALTMALLNNKISRFKTIMMKTVKGEGCQQLQYAIENQEELEEPIWRAALSVANYCEDRDKAIYVISNQHPAFDPNEAEDKARKTKGPYTCEVFEKLRPGGCEGCPNKGEIKSPITLGQDIARDEPDENEEFADEYDEEGELVEIADSPYPRPMYPAPYFRGKNGGIYKNMGDEEPPMMIYEHDLVLVKRLVDPNLGECAWLRRFLPKDGVEEFALPMSSLLSKDKMRETLPAKGVIAGQKQMEAIMNYLITVAKEMQVTNSAEKMRTQFGWADNDSKIIIGDREITDGGVFYSPPSTLTAGVSAYMKPVGSFDKWKEAFNTYSEPGFEPHAFAALTAFGAPLMKFLNIRGCLINLVNNESGTGKSTILHMANSVIGHPEELLLQWKDTYNAMIHRFGVMNNFMVGIDEITKMHPEVVSDLLYSITQGRGKNRMKQSSNEERLNTTKWALPTVSTSNASIIDKISSLKSTFDGEMMRFIEYQINLTGNISKSDANRIFGSLFENYGHAADPYLKYCVSNKAEAIDLVRKVQFKLDKDIGLESRERFWSVIAACNIAGGMISQSLSLHDYRMKQIYQWLVPTIDNMRKQMAAPKNNAATVVGEFINKHMTNILVVNGNSDLRTNLPTPPILEPRGELIIRMEPDTKKMFISVKHFRKFCSESQYTCNELLKDMKSKNILLDITRKRMSRGSKVNAPAIDALMLDCSSPDFVTLDDYVQQAQTSTEE
jgi:hypothetical protein